MTFTERIEKLLGANNIKAVIDEFLKFLNEVPQSNRDARSDANQLRGQVIVLSGRFTDLNTKINTNIIDFDDANQEKSMLINSFIQILNQLPSSYPDLNNYMEEKNEDDAWKDAQDKNIIEAYQVYFTKYPNGKYKAATIKLIAELEEVKLKQDMEIKRLAMLEKERRENDKVAAEPEKVQRAPIPQTQYRSAAPVSSSQPPKSRKGLYIALGAVLGIVFLIIVAVSTNNDSPTYTDPDPAPAVDNTGTPSEAVKAELKLALELANETLINAAFYMNASSLSKSFTGECLKTLNTSIETLITNDTYIQYILENREFKNFKVSNDGLEAEILVEETWNYIYYSNATKTCSGKIPSHKSSTTVFLKKTENGWLVSSFIEGNEPVPQLVSCD